MKYLSIIFLFLFLSISSKAEQCYDYSLLNGAEPLLHFGMDTTDNWWAITQPYSNQVRVTINGEESKAYKEVSIPIFSHDSYRYAYFAKDAAQMYLVTEDTIITIRGDGFGSVMYTSDSKNFIYTYKYFDEETVVLGDRQERVYQRNTTYPVFVDRRARKYAYVGERAGSYVVDINGQETTTFKNIIPFGFWHDGKFMYAAQNGEQWQIYKDEEAVTDYYDWVSEVKINLDGTVAAFLAKIPPDGISGVIISDEYYDPIVTKKYKQANSLVLHPREAMIAFRAVYQVDPLVVYNSAEYYAGEYASVPQFSYDGSELMYVACRLDCQVVLNGRLVPVQTGLDPDQPLASKPGSETIAFVTSSGLTVKYLNRKLFASGMMIDITDGKVRYNWREGRYEALGVINNRLYLLTCRI